MEHNNKTQPRYVWFKEAMFAYWPLYAHGIVASVFINILVLASPFYTMNIYDRIAPNGAMNSLWALSLGMMLVLCFDTVLKFVRGYFFDIAGKKIDITLSGKVYDHVFNTRMAQQQTSVGHVAHAVKELEGLRSFVTSSTLTALVDIPFSFLFLLMIASISGWLAVIPLIALVVVCLFAWVLQSSLQRMSKSYHDQSAYSQTVLLESLDNIESIKINTSTTDFSKRWNDSIHKLANTSNVQRLVNNVAMLVAGGVGQLVTIAIMIAGVYAISENTLTMGGLVATSILAGRVLAPISTIAMLMMRLQQSKVGLETLDAVLGKPVEKIEGQQFFPRDALLGNWALKEVTFRYAADGLAILDNINLDIKAGEKVGILGRAGSGKSTLTRLLLGLYQPERGIILADNTDIRQLDPDMLRRQTSYAGQTPFIVSGTIRDNLNLGLQHPDEQVMLRTAAQTGLLDVLQQHPHGFDWQVGENGRFLSGGQKQLVAITRALMRGASTLILDEATSQLDHVSEQFLLKNLKIITSPLTLIVITHHPSLLELCERVVVVEAGRIVADDKRDKIIKNLGASS